jgi:hypothetical protein
LCFFLSYINICQVNSVVVLFKGKGTIFLSGAGFGLLLVGFNFSRSRLRCLDLIDLRSLRLYRSGLFFNGCFLVSGLRLLGVICSFFLLLLVWLLSNTAFLTRLLLTGEVGVQKYHTIVHNLQVLAQQTKIAIELTQESVNV